ncbi:MAG: hypothetical protein AAF739_07115 [Pseudomonadota bacterium]
MSDPYGGHTSGLESPASDAFVITPADGTPLPQTTRAVYVGSGGDIAVTTKAGTSVVLTAVPSGTILPIRLSAVSATGTTASDMVGLL